MSAEPPPDAVPILLNGLVQDPNREYAQDAKKTDFIIISFYNVLSIPQEDELERLSVKILEDLGENNFLCEYLPEDLAPLRALDFVRQVDVYRNKFKIPAALQAEPAPEIETTAMMTTTYSIEATCIKVDIFTHQTVDDAGFESLKDVIAEASGVSVGEMEFAPGQVRLCVEIGKLATLAKDDRIRIIEEVLEPELMSYYPLNNDDRAAGSGTNSTAADNMSGKNKETAYRGKGQIVTVTDTGFDLGGLDDCHPAFTGKVHALRAIARQGQADDPHGHGTHVSGILVGSHFNTTKGRVGGVAPDARLIVQSLFKKTEKVFDVPANLVDLFAVPYGHGSRIMSNSWGAGYITSKREQPAYGNIPGAIDKFVRENPDVLVLFSAGNDNLKTTDGQPTVGLHSGAKNVLTVGATQRGPNGVDEMMNPMSSTGPTREGRLKPDVVAPGTDVYAALSRKVARFEGETATSEDAPAGVKWRPWSGTSQAVPFVAGCAAILRQVLQDHHREKCPNPLPGALLKALIINGADTLPGVSVNAQGHGRVNLDASIAMARQPPASPNGTTSIPSVSGGAMIGDPLKQDEAHEFVIPAADAAPLANGDNHTHFKITMVYNDLGGRQIQNNLNLFVTDTATGEETPGNSRSLDDPDQQNNVEQIVLGYIPQDGIKVRVHAQKIFFRETQDYVLAWSTFKPLPEVVY
ncbi:peptidase S8/S53 domain-containing protein [Apodospora peruviana]|uniref:Peptidase S8/S53 domain-containing protein n=1 Tax=Apodospora peruviana TaxID=516989 RepID=A0AAE0M1Y1_9PEZI|nr:peptidase S8/S53 domain-containing protein [Apodospora peruviana]